MSKTSSQTTLWHCADSANTGKIARIWALDAVRGFLGRDCNYNALIFTKMRAIHLSSAILPKMLAQALLTKLYSGAPRLKSPPGYRKSKAIPLLPRWTFTACRRVNFTFTFTQAPKNLTQIFVVSCVHYRRIPTSQF